MTNPKKTEKGWKKYIENIENSNGDIAVAILKIMGVLNKISNPGIDLSDAVILFDGIYHLYKKIREIEEGEDSTPSPSNPQTLNKEAF